MNRRPDSSRRYWEARRSVAETFSRIALSRPVPVLVAWCISCVVATFGVMRLGVETSTESVLDRSSESWSFYQDSQSNFGGDEILVVAIESVAPLERETLSRILDITDNLEGVAGVRRVDSVFTVPLVTARTDGYLSLQAAFEEGIPESRDELERIGSELQRDRLAPGSLVSRDSRSFAAILVLEQGAEEHYEHIIGEISRELNGTSAWVSGVPIFRSEANAKTRQELLIFTPLTVVAIGLLVSVIFRSLPAVLILLLTSGCASWNTLGIMGALGVPITISTVILPSVLLALGSAYTMHFLVAGSSPGGVDARNREVVEVAPLVVLSGLTTTIGFVAMSLVRIEAIRQIGIFGALGVLIVLAASVTMVPAAMQIWPLPERSPSLSGVLRTRLAPLLSRAACRFPRSIAMGTIVIAVGIGSGIKDIRVETDVIVWFEKDHPIRVAYRAIRERFSGISPMNLVIEAPSGRTVTEPAVIRRLEALTRALEETQDVGKAISVADPIDQMHKGFMGNPDAPLPAKQDLVEQYLLLLESKPQINDLVTSDHLRANVLLRVDDNGSDALLAVAKWAEDWWANQGVEGYSARATGIMFEFARAEDEIAWGQIRGLACAVVAVTIVLLAVLRSGRLAFLSLIPNAVPIAIAFGLMGILDIALDAGTILVGNLALGIAVDDTLHVASRFHQRVSAGEMSDRAIRWTLERVISPVTYTTIAIALGFAVLGLSSFTFTRNLGILTSLILVLCLLADVILLPALLSGLSKRGEKRAVSRPQQLIPG